MVNLFSTESMSLLHLSPSSQLHLFPGILAIATNKNNWMKCNYFKHENTICSMEVKTSDLVHEEVKINSNLQCMQSALHCIILTKP